MPTNQQSRSRYPFDQLAVGEAATVDGVPNRNAIHVAKNSFHQKCRQLGYKLDELPAFLIEYDPDTGSALITRLKDGTVLPRGPAPRASSRAAKRREHAQRVALADADVQAHMLRVHEANKAGLPIPAPSDELVDRCRALGLAGHGRLLADLVCDASAERNRALLLLTEPSARDDALLDAVLRAERPCGSGQ